MPQVNEISWLSSFVLYLFLFLLCIISISHLCVSSGVINKINLTSHFQYNLLI